MATTEPEIAEVKTPTDALAAADVDHCVVLDGVDWAGYLDLLRIRGERSSPRIVYADGRALLVAPAYSHERIEALLDYFVVEAAVGLRLRFRSSRKTTLRRRRRGGVEGDLTYYFANAPRIAGKSAGEGIDLRVDPPPDLAIEVVWTHPADDALKVYRRLRVPEVWVWRDGALTMLGLGPDRRYRPIETSRALPVVTPADVRQWVAGHESADDDEHILALRRWVAEELAPRRRPAAD